MLVCPVPPVSAPSARPEAPASLSTLSRGGHWRAALGSNSVSIVSTEAPGALAPVSSSQGVIALTSRRRPERLVRWRCARDRLRRGLDWDACGTSPNAATCTTPELMDDAELRRDVLSCALQRRSTWSPPCIPKPEPIVVFARRPWNLLRQSRCKSGADAVWRELDEVVARGGRRWAPER